MERDNAFELLREELDNDDVSLLDLDSNQSKRHSQDVYSYGKHRTRKNNI